MARKPSSERWQQRQARDVFVRRAREQGWRSRAVFKLMELQRRDRLLRHASVVVDLGAAPGGWSQYAAGIVGPAGRVIAVDLLEMEPVAGVEYIQGDFADEAITRHLESRLGTGKADLVMSDMSPNISGNWSVDQPRSVDLAERVLEFAGRVLASGGGLLMKVFQGEGCGELQSACRARFSSVRLRKPTASRAASREIYVVARNYRL